MADNGLSPIDGSSNWGPRAIEYQKRVQQQGQDGAYKVAQKSDPRELNRILQAAKPPEAQPQGFMPVQDSVALSPDALGDLQRV